MFIPINKNLNFQLVVDNNQTNLEILKISYYNKPVSRLSKIYIIVWGKMITEEIW